MLYPEGILNEKAEIEISANPLYSRRDLNPHGRNGHWILSPTCLPVPPLEPVNRLKNGWTWIKKRRRPAFLSEKRDSNPRPPPWQGGALPTELFSHFIPEGLQPMYQTFNLHCNTEISIIHPLLALPVRTDDTVHPGGYQLSYFRIVFKRVLETIYSIKFPSLLSLSANLIRPWRQALPART